MKLEIALCGGTVLEEALDLSLDRILNECIYIYTYIYVYIYIYIYIHISNSVDAVCLLWI